MKPKLIVDEDNDMSEETWSKLIGLCAEKKTKVAKKLNEILTDYFKRIKR